MKHHISTTDFILAFLGKVEMLILSLKATDSDSAKMSDNNLTSLVRILAIPGAFLELRVFRMVLIFLGVTSELQLEEGIKMEMDWKFLFLWISSILG